MKNKNKKGGNAYKGTTIDQLLAAPFIAATSANSVMAKKQLDFLMEQCFEQDKDGSYSPKLITLTMTKSMINTGKDEGFPDIQQVSTNFQVPLLILLPINSLTITDLCVKFNLEITSHRSKGKKDEGAELKAVVSYNSSTPGNTKENPYQHINSSDVFIEVNAGSIPLPVGFTSLLDLYSKNINTLSFDKKDL